MTIFFSDMEPLSQYSPVKLYLSPVTRILSENPEMCTNRLERNSPDTLLIPGQVSPGPWVIVLEVQDTETFL